MKIPIKFEYFIQNFKEMIKKSVDTLENILYYKICRVTREAWQ